METKRVDAAPASTLGAAAPVTFSRFVLSRPFPDVAIDVADEFDVDIRESRRRTRFDRPVPPLHAAAPGVVRSSLPRL